MKELEKYVLYIYIHRVLCKSLRQPNCFSTAFVIVFIYFLLSNFALMYITDLDFQENTLEFGQK